jgi:hypothetical protein
VKGGNRVILAFWPDPELAKMLAAAAADRYPYSMKVHCLLSAIRRFNRLRLPWISSQDQWA